MGERERSEREILDKRPMCEEQMRTFDVPAAVWGTRRRRRVARLVGWHVCCCLLLWSFILV